MDGSAFVVLALATCAKHPLGPNLVDGNQTETLPAIMLL